MEIFIEMKLSDFTKITSKNLKIRVDKADRDYLLNVNETQYIEHLVSEFRIDPLVLHLTEMKISHREKWMPAENHPHPPTQFVHGQEFPVHVITYHIPYTGDPNLFQCCPSPHLNSIIWTHEFQIQDDYICFDVINLG